mmetsp:Transcript_121050/g.214126  ORF Transcript_121050/g.214126 Transcript_121050/m.214126 type:complete len:203 (-) Transcript_121050:964-1572(-)
MMSRCFRSSCLYRLTCALSSSIVERSRSNSVSFNAYSMRIRSCSATACRNCGVSSTCWPPTRSCEDIWRIRSSSCCFWAFSCSRTRLLSSKAETAARRSSSARRLSSSSSSNCRLSTTLRFRSRSSARNRRSSPSYLLSNVRWSTSSFTWAQFLIAFARWANFSVERDSAKASAAGDTIAIMVVRQLPPSESSRRRVSLESL